MLKRLPPAPDDPRQELDLQMALGRCLLVARATGAPGREPVLVRARELCEQLGDTRGLMEVLLAIAAFRLTRREHGPARELAESALALAERLKAPAALASLRFGLRGLIPFIIRLSMASWFKTMPNTPALPGQVVTSG